MMGVVQNSQKVPGTNTNNMIKKYVATPTCAGVVVSAVVSAPTEEYAHPYSMTRRRLPSAGIDVEPHYHQLLGTYRGRVI